MGPSLLLTRIKCCHGAAMAAFDANLIAIDRAQIVFAQLFAYYEEISLNTIVKRV